MSFGVELAIVRAMLRSNPERRGWLAAEGFPCRPLATPEHKPALPARAVCAWGAGRGAKQHRKVLRKSFEGKSLLILDGVTD